MERGWDFMKVTVEELSSVKKVMHVEIPEQDVNQKLDKAYKTLKNNLKLKGFRPGKVPLSLLEKRFKKEIQEEVSGELIQSTFSDALGEVELKPLGEPALDRPELERGKAYKYSATVEVRPPLQDLELKGLKLTKKVHLVDDDEVEQHLKIIQKRAAELKSVEEDRPVKETDVVIIDYEGFKDGEVLEPARGTENFQVEIGSGRILPDFEKQLVGMSRDSTKEVQVRFPDDYFNKALAGLEVTFKVTLKEIKEEILPVLDDEFAKDMGEYETLHALKKAIKENLESTYEAQSKRELRNQIIDKMFEQSDFELPQGLVEEELASISKDAESLMAQRGVPVKHAGLSDDELREKYRPLAERKVKEYLLVEKVIQQEGITLTDDILEEAYAAFAQTLGQPVEMIKEYHESDKEALEVFKQKTLEKQAIKHITDKSDLETVEVQKEAFEESPSEG
jgi:trigger factor